MIPFIKTKKMTKEEKDILERLKQFAETDLMAANKALSADATDYDIRIALYMAHTLGIG